MARKAKSTETEDLILNRVPAQRKEDYRTLFSERLAWEGRSDEYETTLRDVMAEMGTTLELKAQPEARRRCGIKSPDEERALAFERRGSTPLPSVEQARADTELDPKLLAMLGLPHQVQFPIEIDWVCGHPKMLVAKEKGEIKLTFSDVQAPPHGRAPSVKAVCMLAYYVNRPGDLFKLSASMAKEGDGGAAQDSEKDLSQITSMLRELGETV